MFVALGVGLGEYGGVGGDGDYAVLVDVVPFSCFHFILGVRGSSVA